MIKAFSVLLHRRVVNMLEEGLLAPDEMSDMPRSFIAFSFASTPLSASPWEMIPRVLRAFVFERVREAVGALVRSSSDIGGESGIESFAFREEGVLSTAGSAVSSPIVSATTVDRLSRTVDSGISLSQSCSTIVDSLWLPCLSSISPTSCVDAISLEQPASTCSFSS